MLKVVSQGNKYYLYEGEVNLGECKPLQYKKNGVDKLSYRLPENSLGRKWVEASVIADGLTLTPHVERTQEHFTYTAEEREELKALEARIAEIKAQAQAKARATRPLTKREKLLREIARLQAKLDQEEAE